jgi:ABC-type antimicrobial peptide transport system permease subunit
MVALGAVIGVGAAAALARFVRSLLYGVTAQDPSAMALAVLVLAAVAALAVLVPARRALRVQPSVALRCE